MAEWVKQVLARPIHLADEVTKAASTSDRLECQDLKPRSERLAGLLRQAARSTDLYERPARRIVDDTSHVLEKALSLIHKCSHQSLLSRLFTITPAAAFKKISTLLDNSIGDLSWLLRVSRPDADDDAYLGLPPIAANEPILGLIWEHVARLQNGSLDHRADAAASLASLADNDRYRKLIVEEGAVVPLLKLVKDARLEGQENAVRAIGLLGNDPESVEAMVQAGACSVLTGVLKDGTMKVQSSVAKAVAEFAAHFPKSQDMFLQNNAVRLLVGHLAFETVEEHSKYSLHHIHQRTSMHSVVQSTMTGNSLKTTTTATSNSTHHPAKTGGVGSAAAAALVMKGREMEDPSTKAHMKAMAAKALSCLCRDNASICKSVTESKALLCFAVLLEKGTGEVRSYSAAALMEIALVAEKDADLRHSAFKPTTPAAKAVVDQLLKVVEKGEYSDLLIPCIVALGCLSKTFRASETRIIPPLVKFLDQRELDVMKETVLALTKFACKDNFLCVLHSKAIIEAGGARHLIQLVYFEEQEMKIPALILLCYIAKAVPDSEDLAEADVLNVLEWASKQTYVVQDETLDTLLPDTRSSLELYQSRASGSKSASL